MTNDPVGTTHSEAVEADALDALADDFEELATAEEAVASGAENHPVGLDAQPEAHPAREEGVGVAPADERPAPEEPATQTPDRELPDPERNMHPTPYAGERGDEPTPQPAGIQLSGDIWEQGA